MVKSRMVNYRSAVGAGGLLLWLAAITVTAAAQDYKKIPRAIMDPREVSALRREVNIIVRSGGALSSDDEATLKKYYLFHVIAGMTQDEALTNPNLFPSWRKSVIGDLDSLGGARQKHDFVRDQIYRAAGKLSLDREYSPAFRYNALLLVGDLNEREAQGGGRDVTPAVPYAPVRALLLRVLDSDDTQEMKVAAMIGLARHSRLMAAAGTTPDPKIVQAFIEVMRQTEPQAGGTKDGLIWQQRIAIDALGDIGMPQAAQLYVPILTDSSAPMMLRCAAAEAVGRLDYSDKNATVDHAALYKGLGQLATAALGQQIQGLQKHIQENPPDLTTNPLRSTEAEVPEDPYVQRVRRQLKYQLICVGRGLRALGQVTTDAATKNAITALQSEIGAILKQLDGDGLMPQDLFDKIGPPAVRLENAIKNA